MDLNPTGKEGMSNTIQAPIVRQTTRDHLDMVVEDVAGKLEKKAKQIRTVAGMTPKDITPEQFDAMLALICAMR